MMRYLVYALVAACLAGATLMWVAEWLSIDESDGKSEDSSS